MRNARSYLLYLFWHMFYSSNKIQFLFKALRPIPLNNYFKNMSEFLIMGSLSMTLLSGNAAQAKQHSYDPNTDNDGGQEFGDCLTDINKFCKAWAPLLFELENCLQGHISYLTPTCRSHMENTDFQKYHNNLKNLPDF